jgi:hypothetical protein
MYVLMARTRNLCYNTNQQTHALRSNYSNVLIYQFLHDLGLTDPLLGSANLHEKIVYLFVTSSIWYSVVRSSMHNLESMDLCTVIGSECWFARVHFAFTFILYYVIHFKLLGLVPLKVLH